jgi:hypothetical protein
MLERRFLSYPMDLALHYALKNQLWNKSFEICRKNTDSNENERNKK